MTDSDFMENLIIINFKTVLSLYLWQISFCNFFEREEMKYCYKCVKQLTNCSLITYDINKELEPCKHD